MKRAGFLSMALTVILIISRPLGHLQAQEDIPRFEPADCPIDVPKDQSIECGYLVVPEDYGKPEGSALRLPVIIIHSRSEDPAPDPVLYTAGGPGWSSLSAVWWLANSAFVEDRDVVILEQRGNRYAEPSLTCDVSVWWEEVEGNTPCLDSLKDRGIDLADYTTEAIVADIHALRDALDYDEWNLYGTSYSTTLMLLTMHAHPEDIRSVILVSTRPPTETKYEHDPEHAARALHVLLDDCAADPGCASAYPELEAQLCALISRLNAEPVSFELLSRRTGEAFIVSVDGHDLLSWIIVQSLYGPAYLQHETPHLPLLIHEVEGGNTDLLYPWVDSYWADLLTSPAWAWGLYFAVNCQESLPSADPEIMAAQAAAYPELEGYVRHQSHIPICGAWDLPAVAPVVSEPVESDVPTLILAGAYDPITPPDWGQAVAENLSTSHYFEFPSAGHSVATDNPCAESIMVAFLNDPATQPDPACMATGPGPEFVLPQDVAIAASLYEIHYGEIGYTSLEHNLFLACILVFIAEIGFLVVAGIVRLVRRREPETQPDPIARFAHPLAGLVAMLNVGFSLALRSVLRSTAATAPLALRFGLPAEHGPLFIIPVVTAISTVGLVLIAVLAWVRGYWSVLGRVSFTVVTLAAVVFAGLAAYWGVLTLPF